MTHYMTHPRHFNAYHHNDSLLFQFIISEFIAARQEMEGIQTCVYSRQDNHKEMEERLTKLVGFSHEYMRLFPWNLGDGILFKLKNYCALFSQNAEAEEKDVMALLPCANKLWGACLSILEEYRENSGSLAGLQGVLEKAQKCLKRLANLIARLIPTFRDDENVLFYVIRHHLQLDAHFGLKFISKLLYKIFPKGVEETYYFLTKKYKERGFNNLLPAIEGLIAEIRA